MLDKNKTEHKTQLSQIEINTISCSFGAATCKVSSLHEYNLKLTDNHQYLPRVKFYYFMFFFYYKKCFRTCLGLGLHSFKF